MKRVLAWLLMLCMMIPLMPLTLAEEEEEEEPAAQEEVLLTDPNIVLFSDNNLPIPVGPQYPDLTLDDFDKKSPAIYTCRMKGNTSGYTQRSITSEKVFDKITVTGTLDILYVDPLWVIVRHKGNLAYVKRHRITNVEPVDSEAIPPYGVQKHQYVAKTADTAEVRVSMSHEDKCWAILKPGTTLSIWRICGEWAVVNYWRTYGYIHISDLTDLVMVSPTDQALNSDSPIAAYTSYYKMVNTESNANRLVNIDVGITRMSVVLQPGESFDCNKQMGPYKKAVGYLEAGILNDGEADTGIGGGTCQVSSTIYNALLQLPGVKILQRRAHGDNGAPYLPHGVDAAVGNSELNLRFRNDYDFPIRLEGHTNYDGALCWLIYRADDAAVSASAE
ncbi:MAG: VanW family protein [Clostridia bacterium]|nr:VanW family protein [Clostridia bacterium]